MDNSAILRRNLKQFLRNLRKPVEQGLIRHVPEPNISKLHEDNIDGEGCDATKPMISHSEGSGGEWWC